MLNIERLRTLATFLRTVPVEQFNLSGWFCKTAACACGWATTIPEFQEAGLKKTETGVHHSDGSPVFTIGYGTRLHWDAVRAFFDLAYDDAADLFHEEYYPCALITPDMVADRILAFISQHKEMETDVDGVQVYHVTE